MALIVVLVLLMASYYALLGWLAVKILPERGVWRWYVGLPALWLLCEWWRGWFLSGFPWFSLGYSQTDTWLSAYAPVLGVYGLSALLLLQAGALAALWPLRESIGLGRAGAARGDMGGWLGLGACELDTSDRCAPCRSRFCRARFRRTRNGRRKTAGRPRSFTASSTIRPWERRLIVWPEAAVPELANEIARYLAEIQARARSRGSDVVMGVVRLGDNGVDYYNSIIALTGGVAFYDKRHLVMFAETFPVPAFVRSWLRLLSLPYSDFAPGSDHQAPLAAAGMHLAPSICYEDAFGSAQLGSGQALGLAGQCHQRRLVRTLPGALPAPADQSHAGPRGGPLSAACGQRRRLGDHRPAGRVAGRRARVPERGVARNRRGPQRSIPVYPGRQLGRGVLGAGRARRGVVPRDATPMTVKTYNRSWSNLDMANESIAPRTVGLVLVAALLSACTPQASTAAPARRAGAHPRANSVPAAPLVRGLPDFATLVEQVGPAVVNVTVVEKRQRNPLAGGGNPFSRQRSLQRLLPPVPAAAAARPAAGGGRGLGVHRQFRTATSSPIRTWSTTPRA